MEDHHIPDHLLITLMVVRDMVLKDPLTASITVTSATRRWVVQAFTRGVYQFLFECCLLAQYKPDESSTTASITTQVAVSLVILRAFVAGMSKISIIYCL